MKEAIRQKLLSFRDIEYKKFNQKLIPTVSEDRVIGIRTPILRKYARELDFNECGDFLRDLPHFYFEENTLHALILEQVKGCDLLIRELDIFLPYVDNWATCDTFSPKIFEKECEKLIKKIPDWLKSKHTYEVRFGIGMLMKHFLNDKFDKKYLLLVCDIKSEEYYINMMRAWYFATALAKQYDDTVLIIEQHKLDLWTHNKAIQKACESRRLTDAQKQHLRQLKIKNAKN